MFINMVQQHPRPLLSFFLWLYIVPTTTILFAYAYPNIVAGNGPINGLPSADGGNNVDYNEKLGDELRRIAAQNISKEAKRAMSFSVHDTNKDGFVSVKELKTAKLAWDLSGILGEPQFSEEFKELDADGKGCLSFQKFLANDDDVANHAKIIEAIMDTNGDGCVDKEELRKFYAERAVEMNDYFFQRAFPLIDLNGDGKLSEEEFMAIDWKQIRESLFGTKGNTVGQ